MTLVQLSYVVALDRYRHFGRAADHCFVSQPTLSAQLQRLEEELGAQLFDRSRQPVVPTDLGRAVVEQARRVLREAARIPDLVAEAGGEIRGELRLGIIPTLAPYLLPLVVTRFSAAYPQVDLSLREMTTDRMLGALERDELDAGLLATAEPQANLFMRPLFTEPFVAYVAPEHRLAGRSAIAPADLSLDDLWLLSDGHCFREQVLEVCAQSRRGEGPTIRFESGNLETLRKMVEWSGGMTLLPYLATLFLTEEQRRTYVRPFEAPAPYREVRLAHGRAQLKRPLLNAFVHTVEETLRDRRPLTIGH